MNTTMTASIFENLSERGPSESPVDESSSPKKSETESRSMKISETSDSKATEEECDDEIIDDANMKIPNEKLRTDVRDCETSSNSSSNSTKDNADLDQNYDTNIPPGFENKFKISDSILETSSFSPKSKPFVPRNLRQISSTDGDGPGSPHFQSPKHSSYTMEPYIPSPVCSSPTPTVTLNIPDLTKSNQSDPSHLNSKSGHFCQKHCSSTPCTVKASSCMYQSGVKPTNINSNHKSFNRGPDPPGDKIFHHKNKHHTNCGYYEDSYFDGYNYKSKSSRDFSNPSYPPRGMRSRGKFISRFLNNYSHSRGGKFMPHRHRDLDYEFISPYNKKFHSNNCPSDANVGYLDRDIYHENSLSYDDTILEETNEEDVYVPPFPRGGRGGSFSRGQSLYHPIKSIHSNKRGGGFSIARENEDFYPPNFHSGPPQFQPPGFRFRGRRNGFRHFGSQRGNYGRGSRFKLDQRTIPINSHTELCKERTVGNFEESPRKNMRSPNMKSSKNQINVKLDPSAGPFRSNNCDNIEDLKDIEHTEVPHSTMLIEPPPPGIVVDPYMGEMYPDMTQPACYYSNVPEMIPSPYVQTNPIIGTIDENGALIPDATVYPTPETIPYENYVEAISNPPAFVLTPENQADATCFHSIPFPEHSPKCNQSTTRIEIEANEESNADTGEVDFHQEYINGNLEDYDGFVNDPATEVEGVHVVHFHINPGTTVNFTRDGTEQKISGEYSTDLS